MKLQRRKKSQKIRFLPPSDQVYKKRRPQKTSLISLKDRHLVIPDGIIGVFYVFLS